MGAVGKEQPEPNHVFPPYKIKKKMQNRKTKLQGRKYIFSSGS